MDIEDKTKEELIIELQEFKQAYHSLKFSLETDLLERKMAEEKLIAYEQRNRVWLENSPVCTKIVDLDFNLQYMSNAGIKELKIDDITPYYGKPYPFHFYPESFKTKMTGNMMKAKETGEIITQEAPVVDINGNEIWFHSTIVPVNDENGQIEYLIIVSLDTTERKQAEEALQKSHELLNTTFDSLNDAVFILDDQAAVVKCNHAASRIFGYSQDEIQGQTTAFLHIDESTLAEFRQYLYSAIELKGRMDHFEFRMKRRDGTIFPTDHSIIPLVSVQGRRSGWVSVVRDITERNRSERVLEEIISKNPMSIQIVDLNGYTLSVNSSHTKLFGSVPPPDFTIFNDTQLEKQGFKELFDRVKNGEIVHFPDTYFNIHDFNPEFPDVPVWVQGVVFPLLDSNGNPERFVLMQDDITERRKAEEGLKIAKEQAEESDKLKSAFLSNMSHEIRTPMNGILGFAELLSEPGLDKEEQQEYIKIIQKGGARMLNIINDIVDISKIESGLMKVDLTDTNINEKIEFIYTFFKPQVEEKGMQLRFKNTLTAKEATIKTDSEKVFSILTNLVKNAIKYCYEGSIEIGYEIVESFDNTEMVGRASLRFYVKDTGIGIPKDRQEAIFERFIQADIADKMARQGAGLGLSISKAYVEMLGGRIWVESEEGIGSTFYFTLPYTAEPEVKVVAENTAPADIAETLHTTPLLKILIAEDDETSERLISIAVKTFIKHVIEAKTGNETVEICRTNPDIDLILMDILMPGMNGYEATRQIRQFNKDVVIIAQTAYGLSGDREKAIEAGCNDYIAKPIKKEELLELIKKYFKK